MHLNAKTAFLNGELKEVIYMKQPSSFSRNEQEKMCLLKRSIYGLNQLDYGIKQYMTHRSASD